MRNRSFSHYRLNGKVLCKECNVWRLYLSVKTEQVHLSLRGCDRICSTKSGNLIFLKERIVIYRISGIVNFRLHHPRPMPFLGMRFSVEIRNRLCERMSQKSQPMSGLFFVETIRLNQQTENLEQINLVWPFCCILIRLEWQNNKKIYACKIGIV